MSRRQTQLATPGLCPAVRAVPGMAVVAVTVLAVATLGVEVAWVAEAAPEEEVAMACNELVGHPSAQPHCTWTDEGLRDPLALPSDSPAHIPQSGLVV